MMNRKIDNCEMFALVEASVSEGCDVVLRVVGDSMLPFIRGGADSVKFTPLNTKTLRKGDIVLFRYNGGHVMHRLVWISGNILMARGDGLKGTAEYFGRQDVIAKVSQIIKPDGAVVDTSSFRFRFESYLWRLLLPFRTYLLKLAVRRKS